MDETRDPAPDPDPPAPPFESSALDDRRDFPVVGVGSSAGGLAAVQALLGALPAKPGLAIVLVTHGDPSEESQLTGIFERSTDMEVVGLEEGMQIRKNRVHVCAPGMVPEIEGDRLQPLSVDEEDISHAIDRFFRSLSAAYRSRAIGVVLSGNLSDGAQGLQTIQQRGGIAIVQDPDTAEHPSMPERGISAGHVDHVLAPEAIASELGRVRQRLASAGDEEAIPDGVLQDVFERVREITGVDFSHYKRSTLVRRIHRRMIATGTSSLDEYLQTLRDDVDEVWDLHDESLIHVTSFFRDPEVFDALREQVLPEIADRHPDDGRPIRVWVPGCATGEEVYSLGILLSEYLDEHGSGRRVQMFGTDVSERAIDRAREARYPESIVDDVSEERLQRFFAREDGSYRVCEPLRNACVFARHDLLNDPPFSGIDLVSCRNVLIYLHHDHQEQVANTLHYALEDDGALVLGSSESIQRFENLFDTIDRDHNIYRPREQLDDHHPVAQGALGNGIKHPLRKPSQGVESTETDLRREIDRVVLDIYAPPAIVLDEDLRVTEFRGDVSAYIDPQEGQASLDLMRIAPRGLAVAIRSIVDRIEEGGRPVREPHVGFQRGGDRREVSLRAVPVHPAGASTGFYVVAFEEGQEVEEREVPDLFRRVGGVLGDLFEPSDGDSSERVQELEEELEATRAYLQSVIEEYEATNEELRSAHEEALSTNEELQSTNEELETTKEELQSTNEELTTVNDELRERNEQIQRVNDDLVNLLQGVGLPIVMLGQDLRIRRFTPQAADLLGLIDADEGRPLDDLSVPFDEIDLKEEILEVLDTLGTKHTEITDEEGNPHRLRITPYRTQDDEIDGAVLVFWDVENDVVS